MGVKTNITLSELNKLFPHYKFTNIIPTVAGAMDTTYIVRNALDDYILKKYENASKSDIKKDAVLLDDMRSVGLNVSQVLDSLDDWHIYTKLKGTQPSIIQAHHVTELARFMASLHKYTRNKNRHKDFIDKQYIDNSLNFTKQNFYFYYKKLQSLRDYHPKIDGIIHGDIFKDNTLFHNSKIAVFDFIECGNGSFLFDNAVALIGFGIKTKRLFFIALFLKVYNANTKHKQTKEELLVSMELASKFYALQRINRCKSIKEAKELL